MDLVLLSKYPFLPEARRVVEERGPPLEELLSSPAYAGVRRRGWERVREALRGGSIPLLGGGGEGEALQDLYAYGVARILLSLLDEEYACRRFAWAESLRVAAHLRNEDPAILPSIVEPLGLGVKRVEEGFLLPFTDYLRVATHLKAPEWKLVNRPLERGWVFLDPNDLSRLAQEALRRKLEKDPLPSPPSGAEISLQDEIASLSKELRERSSLSEEIPTGPIETTFFPPCMKHILSELQRGENVPHSARFALTAFLHSLGMSAEEIMVLFREAPDFREEVTRYQVEHITGKSSGTHYTPPSCATMKTYGICYNEDEWCRKERKEGGRFVTHPLSYYRWAAKRARHPSKGIPTLESSSRSSKAAFRTSSLFPSNRTETEGGSRWG